MNKKNYYNDYNSEIFYIKLKYFTKFVDGKIYL